MRRCTFATTVALLVACISVDRGAAAPDPNADGTLSLAVNWATLSHGASVVASTSGYYVRASAACAAGCGVPGLRGAVCSLLCVLTCTCCRRTPQAGVTALPVYAIDEDAYSFWSSAGGATCCTETTPAWLLVSLGVPRRVATLQLYVFHDLTYRLSLSNASDGPYVDVAQRVCVTCEQNNWHNPDGGLKTYVLPAPVAAAFVKLTITWSPAGGIGGCNDVCDWATNIYSLRVLSPGALPPDKLSADAAAATALPAQPTDDDPMCAGPEGRIVLAPAGDVRGDVLLSGSAMMMGASSAARPL